jgi:DNA-binding beta-propeller fold protein YncE
MQMAAAGVPAGGGVVWTDPDLANASYDSVSFSVAGQATSPESLVFKTDGSKVYVLDFATGVNEYDLSTAWDVSTASFVQTFSVSSQENQPRGLSFKPDGTKMYVSGTEGDDVNEYDLSTAWNVSTASYLQNFSVAAQDTIPIELFFKPDGTKMYVLGFSGDDVNEYDLSSAWDISTASFLQNFSVAAQEALPRGLFFNPDGTKMYVGGTLGDAVNEYDLSTAWDVSTASYGSINFSVAAQETFPTAFFFKSDGSKLYVVGQDTDTIYQYSTD